MSDVKTTLKKADRTRRQLLEAALRVIGRKGFAAATVDEIVREAGVSKGVAYYHFKNKESLVENIIAQEIATIEGLLKDVVDREGDPTRALVSMLQTFAEHLFDHQDLARLLSTEIWRGGRAWSQQMRSGLQAVIDMVSQELQRGKEMGTVRAEVDPTFAAASIVGMVVVDAMYYLDDEGGVRLGRDEFVERVRNFVHHALAVSAT